MRDAAPRRAPARGALVLAAAAAVSPAGCATTSPDVARLQSRIRDLQDQVYALERSQEDCLARLERGGAPEPRVAAPAARSGRSAPPSAAPPVPWDDGEDGGVARPPVRALPPGSDGTGEDEPRGTEEARVPSLAPEGVWDRARRSYDRGSLDEAIPLLRSFLENFPDDPQAVEARYLLGESYFAQANFPQAIVEYQEVARGRRTARHPDALYKMGLSYHELGSDAAALESLNRLESCCPGSASAEAAAPLLERLRRKGGRR